MKDLVTGSSGHLGEALVRILRGLGHEVVGLDRLPSPFTTCVGSVTDRDCVRRCMTRVEQVYHAATLHRPHIDSHGRQDFIDINVTGTLNLLEESAAAGVRAFVFASTTSVFGDALTPPAAAPAAWVTEEVVPIPRNIYGVTKMAAETLCQLFYRTERLPCIVLRLSRFFPEEDFDEAARAAYSNDNMKINEYLNRRVDIEDAVSACLRAGERAPAIGFGRYIVSATTPFTTGELAELRRDAERVVRRLLPQFEPEYARRGWKLAPSIERVYVNERARNELGWQPRYDFNSLLGRLRADQDIASPLARLVGSKGYHRGAPSIGIAAATA
jgi:nucleoside-diphosphate-sugar epimerase